MTNTTKAATFFLLGFFSPVILFVAILSCKHNAHNTIITKAVDERGLISVVYTNGPDTFALDYITQSEFDSLITK